MALNAQHTALVGRASRQSIGRAFEHLRLNWASGDWIKASNRYRFQCIDRLKKDSQTGRQYIHKHLRQYIAASAVLHCFDGWSFFGRAIEAELKGHRDVAIHLAYYAELRAAMSLLAAEGIGVFDSNHIVVNGYSRCNKLQGHSTTNSRLTTHVFAWEGLSTWAATGQAADLLFEIIVPGGISLCTWLQGFAVGAGYRSVLASTWLQAWGLDLKRFAHDRDARNLASYRPSAFTTPRATDVRTTFLSARQLWELCEPIGSRCFAELDRYLLRHSIHLTFQQTHRRTSQQARRRFEAQVDRMLHFLDPSGMTLVQWKQFLTNDDSSKLPQILIDARGNDDPTHTRHSKQVLARALLLLRVATGATQKSIGSLLRVDKAELSFWWGPLGIDRGLWTGNTEPESFSDLWLDVREAIEDIADWLSGAASDEVSHHALWQSHAGSAAVLGSTERIALWGLGL